MKGQTEIISAALIVAMSLALFSAAYLWGWPILQKKQDEEAVKRAYEVFNPENPDSIVNAIENVIKYQTTSRAIGSEKGAWNITSDSIIYSRIFKVSPFPANGKWVFISGNPKNGGTYYIDEWYAIYGRSTPFSNGFEVQYKIVFLQLNNSYDNHNYTIRIYTPKIFESSSLIFSFHSISSNETHHVTYIEVMPA